MIDNNKIPPAICPPKAEVEGSNPFGSAKVFPGFLGLFDEFAADNPTFAGGTRRERAALSDTRLTRPIVARAMALAAGAAIAALGWLIRPDDIDRCAAYAGPQAMPDLRLMQEQRLAECRAVHADEARP